LPFPLQAEGFDKADPGSKRPRNPALSQSGNSQDRADHGLHYPLIVKPSRQDGSTGVDVHSVVHDYAQLLRRLDRVFAEFSAPVLVEEFIEGKELHVAVLGNNPPIVLPIVEFNFLELPAEHPALITYDIKWNPLSPAYHKVHSFCPANIDPKVEKLVKEQALRAFIATCCRDYARVDIRLGRDGVPYILEVNPNPDLTEGSHSWNRPKRQAYVFRRLCDGS